MNRVGLRSRVSLSFGVLSLLVALLVSLSTYLVAREYLVSQREGAALTRALLDGRAVDGALSAGKTPGEALSAVPVVGSSQALVRVNETWYTAGVSVSPSDIPVTLVEQAVASGGAQQTFRVGSDPYIGVAFAIDDGYYLELFPLKDLDRALGLAGWSIAVLAALAFLAGIVLGRWAGARLMRPVESLGQGARQVADGDLDVRLPETGDPDLDPIRAAFNQMTEAVRSRIDRERRFAANVSHELRSPLTTVVGTAELLESHQDRMDPVDAQLVERLAGQSRRLSSTLLDLLEIGNVNATVPVQAEVTDVAQLVRSVLGAAGLSFTLLSADPAVVRTDGRRVERVLVNLVENAERHGGGVGEVVVQRTDDTVLVHVDDAGPGVEDAELERLFEPFARGSRSRSAGIAGAGLGLAIAQEQAEAIGGQVFVADSPLGGARFTLELPATPPLATQGGAERVE